MLPSIKLTRNFILSFLIIAIFSYLISWLLLQDSTSILLIFIILPVLLLAISKPKVIIALLIITIYLLVYLSSFDILPRSTKWMIDLLICLLFARIPLIALKGKRLFLPFAGYFIIAIALMIASSLYLGTSPLTILLGIRTHFKYLILFYCVINIDLGAKDYFKYIKVLFLISLAQIPVSIIQVLTYNAQNAMEKYGYTLDFIDIAGGTFGLGDTTGILAVYLACVICFIVASQIYMRNSLKKLLTIILLCIPLYLANARAIYFILPIGVMYLLFNSSTKRPIRVLTVMGSILLLIILIFSSSSVRDKFIFSSTDKITRAFSQESKMSVNSEEPKSAGKIAAIFYANSIVSNNGFSKFFGSGLGSICQSTFSEFSGDLSDKVSKFELKPQVARTLIDTGYLGISLFIIIFAYLYRISGYCIRFYKDPYLTSLFYGFKASIVIFVLGAFYRPIWDTDPTAFAFCLLSAMVYTLYRQAIDSKKMAPNTAK